MHQKISQPAAQMHQMDSSSLALLNLCLQWVLSFFVGGKLGSGPFRGQSSVNKGDTSVGLSVHPSVHPSVRRSIVKYVHVSIHMPVLPCSDLASWVWHMAGWTYGLASWTWGLAAWAWGQPRRWTDGRTHTLIKLSSIVEYCFVLPILTC